LSLRLPRGLPIFDYELRLGRYYFACLIRLALLSAASAACYRETNIIREAGFFRKSLLFKLTYRFLMRQALIRVPAIYASSAMAHARVLRADAFFRFIIAFYSRYARRDVRVRASTPPSRFGHFMPRTPSRFIRYLQDGLFRFRI